MHIADFIIFVYCMIDQSYQQIVEVLPVRQRGFKPKLSDQEVITREVLGEFLGIDTDSGIWTYFRQHWLDWFLALGSRSSFARQAANLWAVKEVIREKLVNTLSGLDINRFVADGFPMPTCHYARSRRQKSFKGEAAYGYCAAKDEKYYGFKGIDPVRKAYQECYGI